MQALDRDPFGLDMLPEVDMSETADEDDTPTGDLHVLPPRSNLATEMATEMLKNYNRKSRKQRPAKQNKIPRAHYVLISGKLVRVEERK
jgi:hypothetical protein